MKAVLDTNTLASGAIASSGTLAALIDAWRKRLFTVIVCAEILNELERTLHKPYFRRRLTARQIDAFLSLVRRRAVLVTISETVQGVATHPEDDVILATAVSANAEYLVTGDRKLQDLTTYRSVTIVSPRAFLGILTSATN